MHYAVVHELAGDTSAIEALRREHDPTVDLLGAHITFLFPVPAAAGPVRAHVEDVASGCRPFPVRLRGLHVSWDGWLFLLVDEGHDDVVALYHALYSGFLAPHRRTDIPFVPHVGLGLFVDADRYRFDDPQRQPLHTPRLERAREQAAELDVRCVVDRVDLVGLRDDFSAVEERVGIGVGATD